MEFIDKTLKNAINPNMKHSKMPFLLITFVYTNSISLRLHLEALVHPEVLLGVFSDHRFDNSVDQDRIGHVITSRVTPAGRLIPRKYLLSPACGTD
ncbi:MAG: hypothetical protein BMS9Abin33_0453 [Gammaproteobacteria bacterium]|nr:MAG: hypothetical protein BMS9Abin33_0453 [Gammaproteobacteria bacterium]